jgi:hypothetical protein
MCQWFSQDKTRYVIDLDRSVSWGNNQQECHSTHMMGRQRVANHHPYPIKETKVQYSHMNITINYFLVKYFSLSLSINHFIINNFTDNIKLNNILIFIDRFSFYHCYSSYVTVYLEGESEWLGSEIFLSLKDRKLPFNRRRKMFFGRYEKLVDLYDRIEDKMRACQTSI